MYVLTNQLDYNDLFDYIHIVKLYNLSQNGQWFLVKWNIQLRWPIIFSQMQHGLLPQVSTSYLFTYLFTWLIFIYLLPTYPHTHLLTYLLISSHLHIYLHIFFTFVQPTYLPTHLIPTYYLPIHPFTYLSLTIRCNY